MGNKDYSEITTKLPTHNEEITRQWESCQPNNSARTVISTPVADKKLNNKQ